MALFVMWRCAIQHSAGVAGGEGPRADAWPLIRLFELFLPKTKARMNTISRRQFHQAASVGAAAYMTASLSGTARADVPQGQRIALVDYNLENYHADTFLKLLRGSLRNRGFDVAAATALKVEEGRRWARNNEVRYVDRVEDLVDLADCFMVLAPDNSEVHLELCEATFPLARPTFVDKTFAPDLATAQKLFDLAKKHQTPMQSSSGLRYTNVQAEVAANSAEPLTQMTAWGGGMNFKDRAIHPIEMLVSCMGHDATHVLCEADGPRTNLLIRFAGGRTGLVHLFAGAETPYAASLVTEKHTRYIPVNMSTLYSNLMSAVLDFFGTGQPTVDPRETLTVMKLIDAGGDPRARGQFMALN